MGRVFTEKAGTVKVDDMEKGKKWKIAVVFVDRTNYGRLKPGTTEMKISLKLNSRRTGPRVRLWAV